MRRRDLLAMSMGALAVSALSARAVSQDSPSDSAGDDDEFARWYDRERKFVATTYGRIAYVERGAGAVALCLHGFPLSSFQWRGVIDRLSSQRRCLAPDLMGLGHTEVMEGTSLTPRAQAEMIGEFLDRLGVMQVDLIANDSGGAIAQLFLAAHSQRVRTLLLTNCDVEIQSPPPALLPIIEYARAGIYPDLYLEPWLRRKDVARSQTSGLGGMCYTNPRNPTDAAIEQYLAPLVASQKRKRLVNAYLSGLVPNPLLGLEPLLGTCRVPTGIVWGMADTIFSPQNAEYLSQVLFRVTGIRRIPEGKVFFPEEYPEIVAEEAQRLWREAQS